MGSLDIRIGAHIGKVARIDARNGAARQNHIVTGKRRLQHFEFIEGEWAVNTTKDGATRNDLAKLIERAVGGQAAIPGACLHVAPCLRIPLGKQRGRHPFTAGVPRPQEHPAHRALHRTIANALQRFLERLSVIDIESSAPMSAFAVAIGAKADMGSCTAHACL